MKTEIKCVMDMGTQKIFKLPTKHQENLEKIKKLTSELSECMRFEDYEKFPTPYTSCDDPEVFYSVDRRWFVGKAEHRSTDFVTKSYSDLPYDCKQIVDDIVTSSQLEVFKQWDKNFRRKYYTKAIFMAYEIGKEDNRNLWTKIRGWFYSLVKFRTIC
jgi:hypothetical protein